MEGEWLIAPEDPQHVQREQDEQSQPPHSLIRYLYVGYFLARWGARMWEFAVGLYMINLWPDSLLLTAMYGAIESGSTAIFGPIVGQWVERLSYEKVLKLWLVSQNFSFGIAGGAVVALFVASNLVTENFKAFICLIALTYVSGAIGVLSTLAGIILIEREWVVVISAGHASGMLTRMNSVTRGIDLTSKLLAPVVTGLIISFASLTASALTFALWATLSIWVEYWLFMSVYRGIPALERSSHRRVSQPILMEPEVLASPEGQVSPDATKAFQRNKVIELISKAPFVSAWRIYLKQQVVLPGVALSLLFFTVLSFGTLMTATLEWDGIPAYVIGIARGISATTGIAATIVYPILHYRISTAQTGLWSIWSQWTCLLVCVGSIWVRKTHVGAYMLMAGVAASRLGLWMFDLSVIQLMQDLVPESERCIVGGVQNSIQSAMDLMGYVMGMAVSDPKDFWKLILLSVSAVTIAALLYTFHTYSVRKPLPRLDASNPLLG